VYGLLSKNAIIWFNTGIFNCEYYGISSYGNVTLKKKWLLVAPSIRAPPGTGSSVVAISVYSFGTSRYATRQNENCGTPYCQLA
jgi:hypothetical protein